MAKTSYQVCWADDYDFEEDDLKQSSTYEALDELDAAEKFIENYSDAWEQEYYTNDDAKLLVWPTNNPLSKIYVDVFGVVTINYYSRNSRLWDTYNQELQWFKDKQTIEKLLDSFVTKGVEIEDQIFKLKEDDEWTVLNFLAKLKYPMELPNLSLVEDGDLEMKWNTRRLLAVVDKHTIHFL